MEVLSTKNRGFEMSSETMELELKEDTPEPKRNEKLQKIVDENLDKIIELLSERDYEVLEPSKTRPPKIEEESEGEKKEETRVIGFAGKGGVGKTTMAALFLRMLLERNSSSVMAVDSDPNLCLPDLLGVENYETLNSVIEKRRGRRLQPRKFKQEFNSLLLKNEQEGYDLLPMGRSEGQGCYCAVNNLLRSVFRDIVLGGNFAYDYVVVDCEAGLEHVSRKTSAMVDDLVIITDGSMMGLNTIRNILDVGEKVKINIDNFYTVANKIRDGETLGRIKKASENLGMVYLGDLPEDSEVRKLGFEGKSIFELSEDSKVYRKGKDVIDKILSKTVS